MFCSLSIHEQTMFSLLCCLLVRVHLMLGWRSRRSLNADTKGGQAAYRVHLLTLPSSWPEAIVEMRWFSIMAGHLWRCTASMKVYLFWDTNVTITVTEPFAHQMNVLRLNITCGRPSTRWSDVIETLMFDATPSTSCSFASHIQVDWRWLSEPRRPPNSAGSCKDCLSSTNWTESGRVVAKSGCLTETCATFVVFIAPDS